MAAGDLVRLVTANELKGSTVYYGTCNTTATTAAKTATIDGFVLEEGSRVLLKMQTNNSAGSPTLNINNTGAKPISVPGGTPNIYWSAGTVLEFVYDGTYWCLLKEGIGNAASYGITKLSDTYATKIANGAAANGVGASQNALYNAYNALLASLNNYVEYGPFGAVAPKGYLFSNSSLLGFFNKNGITQIRSDHGLMVTGHTTDSYAPVHASAFNVNSSRRYKENIKDMPEEMAKQVLQYRPVEFDYNSKSPTQGKNCSGLIAEEVSEVNGYAVYRNENGEIEGLDYSKFVPQLIAMIQLQEKRINELERALVNNERKGF